jgi:Secretion system C-terminal sorting domain
MWHIKAIFKITLLWSLLVSYSSVMAQKEASQWMIGYVGGVPVGSPDTGFARTFGCTRMDFNYSPPDTIRTRFDLSTGLTATSMSDSGGHLMFYTNGVQVYNAQHQLMDNGDSLNPSAVQYWFNTSIPVDGYRSQQGIITMAKPGSHHLYYLFHVLADTSNDISIRLYHSKLLYTTIDMSLNGGLGKVITKNQVLITDTIGYSLSACRHANGRDWWLMVSERDTNCFYRVLIDSTGPHVQPTKICIGSTVPKSQLSQTCFSPDGKWYAHFSTNGGIDIFKFNRCTGGLSQAINYPVPEVLDSFWLGTAVAFSPNSRYLYAALSYKLYQFDLWATNIPASKVTVGLHDGFNEVHTVNSTTFGDMQLGIDGRIYLISGNGSHYMNVIETPDSGGLACHFTQHSYKLPAWNVCMPNYPCYSLGVLTTPHGTAYADTIVCAGDRVGLGLPAIADMSYSWHKAGSSWSSSLPNPTYLADSTAIFYLTVTDTFGGQPCGQQYDTVRVQVQPLPPHGVSTRDTVVCHGDSLHLGRSAIPSMSYYWTQAHAAWTSVASNPIRSMDTSTVFYLTIVDTISSHICKYRYDTMTIRVKPIAPILRGVISDTTICKGDTITLGKSIQLHVSYRWSQLGHVWSSTDISPYKRIDSVSTFYLVMIDTSTQSCGARYDTLHIGLKSQLAIARGAIQDTAVCKGDTITLGKSIQLHVGYTWSQLGQVWSSIDVSPHKRIDSLSTFYLVMIDTSTVSCGARTDTVHVGIKQGCPTGLEDIALDKVSLYPNPANSTLSVSTRQYERDASLAIYDALGREVYANRSFYLDDYIDVRAFPAGVYYVKLQSPRNEYSSKFVKE